MGLDENIHGEIPIGWPSRKTIYILPPFVITKQQLGKVYNAIEQVLEIV